MSQDTPIVKLSNELASAVTLSGIPATVDLCPDMEFGDVTDLTAIVTPASQASSRHTRAGQRLNEATLMVFIISPATKEQLPGLLERLDALIATLLADELPSARISKVEYDHMDLDSMRQVRLYKAAITVTAQYISQP
jgi:hypothetical protein